MADGIEADRLGTIDAIHAQIVGETPAEPTASAAIPAVEAQPAQIVSENRCKTPDTGLCREILTEACESYSQATYDEFYQDLLPVAGHATADRIAKRAAMSQSLQGSVVEYGDMAAEKWGVKSFIDAETALVVAVWLHYRGLKGAKKEREKILKNHGGEKPAVAQPISQEQERPPKPAPTFTQHAPITTIELVIKEPTK